MFNKFLLSFHEVTECKVVNQAQPVSRIFYTLAVMTKQMIILQWEWENSVQWSF